LCIVFSGIVANWYNLLNEEGKNELKIMKTLEAMFKSYARKLKLNLSALNSILKKNQRMAEKDEQYRNLGYEVSRKLYC